MDKKNHDGIFHWHPPAFLTLFVILISTGVLLFFFINNNDYFRALHVVNSFEKDNSVINGNILATSSTNNIVERPLKSLSYNFGISVGDTLYWLSEKDLKKELDDIASLGVGWVRFDMAWDNIQPKDKENFNWTVVDRIVNEANSRQIKLLPDLAYSPKWARPDDCTDSDKCAPKNTEDFANFVKAVVERYSSKGISTWEIWNEPNIKGFWSPNPNPKDYAELLKASYTVIKNQNPEAVVLIGGLAPSLNEGGNLSPITFLEQLYKEGIKNYFDALAFHPYSFPMLPSDSRLWNSWPQMSSTSPSLRSVMIDNGDDKKKIWLTEYGAPTGGPRTMATMLNYKTVESPDHVSEDLQVALLTDAIREVKKLPWAGPMFWYSYKDIGTSNNSNENFFGLIRFDGTNKPAYRTLRSLLENYE